MPRYSAGRYEHGQNYLTDHAVIRRIIHLVGQVPCSGVTAFSSRLGF
ncbi:hypothetical protein [Bowdeniella nasicola]